MDITKIIKHWMEAMKNYRCWFEYHGETYTVDADNDVPAHRGLQAFCHGFWVDINKLKLSINGDIWIPPSKIYHVMRFEVKE